MESVDIVSLLFSKNLEFIIDLIFENLSHLSLKSLSLTSSVHCNIVHHSRVAQRKARKWRRIIEKTPKLTEFNHSSMITCLAQNTETMMYPDHSQHNTIITIWSFNNTTTVNNSEGNIVVEENYPLMVSRLDFNDNIIVVVGANRSSFRARESVECFCRKRKVTLSKIYPHEDAISQITVTENNILISSSFDKKIILTDLSLPHQPQPLLTVTDHNSPVLDFSWEKNNVLSLSSDSALILWKFQSSSLKCAKKIFLKEKVLNKVFLSWPLAAIYGFNLIQLWNLENNLLMRKLELDQCDRLTELTISFDMILAGDVNGGVRMWSLDDIMDGHQDVEGETRRELRTYNYKLNSTIISGTRFITDSSLMATLWDGRILFWDFN